MRIIRNEKGRMIGQIIQSGDIAYLRDAQGHLRGQYIKSADKTFDGQGHYAGNGDQLLRLLHK